MRKTSYVVTFLCVGLTLALNVFSILSTDWLVTRSKFASSKSTVRYGLTKLCTETIIVIPIGSGKEARSTSHECRAFPARDYRECDDKNATFCAAWTTAGYLDELAVGFGAVAMLAILFGLTTHSRRTRIWKAVAWLVALDAVFQLSTFIIVTHLYNNSYYPAFDYARPAVGYIFNGLNWILAMLIAIGVVTTGLSAKAGHRWAAGNRRHYGAISQP